MDFIYEYENLVFEGGGICGLAFSKIPKALQEYDILSGIKRYAGTSIGSIIAMMFALGYKNMEIYDELIDINFNKYIQTDCGIIRDLYRLFKKFGYNGTKKCTN